MGRDSLIDIVKTLVIFVLGALGEITGTYAFWHWRRGGGPAWLVGAGMLLLAGYAFIQTFQPEGEYGRLYAAYAGFFLLAAMVWGWKVDGFQPDRFDVAGAGIALFGAAVILWGRRVFG